MGILNSERYSRSAALTTIRAFLAGDLPPDEFRDWVDAYDWNVEATDSDPAVRDAIGHLELVFHEVDDGMGDLDGARTAATEVQRLLSEAAPATAQP